MFLLVEAASNLDVLACGHNTFLVQVKDTMRHQLFSFVLAHQFGVVLHNSVEQRVDGYVPPLLQLGAASRCTFGCVSLRLDVPAKQLVFLAKSMNGIIPCVRCLLPCQLPTTCGAHNIYYFSPR